MKKNTFLLFTFLLFFPFGLLVAGEGMWIPMLLERLNEKEMREMGMKITASAIYSINQASMKDAIVMFGGGCTGEIVSNQGLLLTNHHCGYGAIQRHSSLENDYLTNGFWAMSREEELPNENLNVTMLMEMKDVTSAVLEGISDNMTESERSKKIDENKKSLIEVAKKDTEYNVVIEDFFIGNQYFMIYEQVFKDIRLVGAPPSNIGKFGGDTDNWMWPRHTGDFAVFRIYVGEDNKPKSYSNDNVPYKPSHHLPISLKGAEKDDFTFVFGYPARTNEYLPSFAIDQQVNITNPIRIKIRQIRLDIFTKYTNNDPKVRIQYASKHAGVANGWKKMIGESKGIRRASGVEKKQQFEQQFDIWANLNVQYKNLISKFDEAYERILPYNLAYYYMIEAGYGVELINFARAFTNLSKIDKTTEKETIDKMLADAQHRSESFFKDYHLPLDKEVAEALLTIYHNEQPIDFRPDFLNFISTKYKSDVKAYVAYLFAESIFTSPEKVAAMLNNFNYKKAQQLQKDPAFVAAKSIADFYTNKVMETIVSIDDEINEMRRVYMRAQMEMQPEKRFYPDANFTLRVSYGKVEGFKPADAVTYKHFTTLDGIMEKENPDIYDYVVEERLKELYNAKDYGRYADKDGSVHVAFIASNHTTGGNSGSPLFNAEGHLIGINFDRCWEGTMSDLMYDPNICRNISVDIRYVLFIIDKFAGASHLIDEMTIVQ